MTAVSRLHIVVVRACSWIRHAGQGDPWVLVGEEREERKGERSNAILLYLPSSGESGVTVGYTLEVEGT